MVLEWSSAGPNPTPGERQRALDWWKRFLALTQDDESNYIPKRHLMTHLFEKLNWHGNPRLYANWHDEGLNRTLKEMCRTVSQQNFESFLLLRMRHALGHAPRGTKRGAD